MALSVPPSLSKMKEMSNHCRTLLLSLLHIDQQEVVLEEEGHKEQNEHKNSADRELDNRNIRASLKLIRCIRREKKGVGFEG